MQAQGMEVLLAENLPVDFRIMNAFRSIIFYIQKIVVPLDLAPLYPIVDAGQRAFCLGNLIALIAVLVISAGTFAYGVRRRPYLLAAWLYYLVMLLPVLGILQSGRGAAADRYTYLPSLSLSLLLAAGAVALHRRMKERATVAHSLRLVPLLCGGLPLVLGVLCVGQIKVWRNSIALWEHQTRIYPGRADVAYVNLGNAYREAGRVDDALQAYRTAMAIGTPQPYTHDGYGCVLLEKGLVDEAIAEFERALAKDRRYAPAYRNLWYAYTRKGLHDEALAAIEKAVELNPRNARAQGNLGLSYFRKGRIDEAETAFRQSLALDSRNYESLANLAMIALRRERPEEAVPLLRRALELEPNDPKCHFNLGLAFERTGQTQSAVASYQQALKLNPDMAAARRALKRISNE
jgi:Flp pilus assembly protein TadD